MGIRRSPWVKFMDCLYHVYGCVTLGKALEVHDGPPCLLVVCKSIVVECWEYGMGVIVLGI